MLKDFFNNIKENAKQGMFRHHFMGKLIDNKEDKEYFYVYYQDRLSAIALSALLDLDFSAEGEEFKITSPTTGKSTALTFYFSPPFKDIENKNTLETDVKSLLATRDYLFNEIKAKFTDSPEFEDTFDALYFVVSYLLHSSNAEDQFKIQKLGELLTCAKNRLYLARPETNSYDQDIVMASAWKNIHYIAQIAQLPQRMKSRFNRQLLVNNMNDIMLAEFQLPNSQRKYERTEAYKSSNDEKRTKTSGFWNYKKMCENFTSTPEMW